MQRSCFLFGHADTPRSVLPILEQAIEAEVIRGVSVFYVGYHGNFDYLAATALRAVKHRHPGNTRDLLDFAVRRGKDVRIKNIAEVL